MITHILTIKLQNKPEEQFHFRQDIGTRYAIGVVLRTISERLIDFNSEFVSPTRINQLMGIQDLTGKKEGSYGTL